MAALAAGVVAGVGSCVPAAEGGVAKRRGSYRARLRYGNVAAQVGRRLVRVSSIMSNPNAEPAFLRGEPPGGE